jgi:hypothetical protein
MEFPKFFRLGVQFEERRISDIPTTLQSEIHKLAPEHLILPGQTVAVAVGSRGIDRHHVIVKTVVDELRRLGALPYIVPAMGSHGGGTAVAQAQILADYGISEDAMGVPVRSGMEVVELGRTEFGMPVYFDHHAAQADRVVLINRIKPHTRFSGVIESGLMKMMAIGLGKKTGAATYHKFFAHYSFDMVVRAIYQVVSRQTPVAFGVAVIENGYQQTAELHAIPMAEIETVESELLHRARAWCPKLPFEQVDLLIIDEIGKDISGAGMDTNVTGLKKIFVKELSFSPPFVDKIFVRDLSLGTKGNAMGLGLADFTTRRLVDKVDFAATYTNAITGMNLRGAKLPIFMDNDRQILDAAFRSLGLKAPADAKVLWIKNTLQLGQVEASIAYRDLARHRPDITLISEPRSLCFDADDNLPLFDQYPDVLAAVG